MANTMLNFAVGPVMADDAILRIGAEQVPYFRTPEFSAVMLDNEKLMLRFTHAAEGSRVVFLTGSGTAAMEALVMNLFTMRDKVLVIDGGSFGHRFVQLLEIHGVPYTVIRPAFGCDITDEQLMEYDGKGYTGFLVNVDETSVGVLYDLKRISAFCKKNDIFLAVDSISSFLCDPFDMTALNVQAMITGSQKALACPPGVSVVVLSEKAVERINTNCPKTLYLDLKLALKDGERGQTPFTPAVGTLLQIHARLLHIAKEGGANVEIKRTAHRASYFRNAIASLPLTIASSSLSNAVTPLFTRPGISAKKVFEVLKEKYGIWICPNGGELGERLFRIGHIGALTEQNYDRLVSAFSNLENDGLL